MKLPFRPNPKTHGWPRRVALSLLTGVAVFLVSLPVSFLLFLSRYQHAYPNDPQNLLGALTGAVVLGLILAVFTCASVLLALSLFAWRTPVSRDAAIGPDSPDSSATA